MEKLKSIDYEILWELLKNSRRSDRELAKILKVSQPTITRRRAVVEKHFVQGYTAIPNWGNIGFELVAFTFVKVKTKYMSSEKQEEATKVWKKRMMGHPNVIFSAAGYGMGWDGLYISFHKSYSDFAEFMRQRNMESSDHVSESQSFIVDLNPGLIGKPLHFKYLAEAK
jgi:DNA-binding Lrp family transcriptional regulator